MTYHRSIGRGDKRFILLILLCFAALCGCASGSGNDSQASFAVKPSSAQLVRWLSLHEPCPAEAVLRHEAGRGIRSTVLSESSARAVQVTATFGEQEEAISAFFGLIAEARQRCIQHALSKIGPAGASVKQLPNLVPKIGEERLLVSYSIAPHRSGASRVAVDVASVRRGLCVISVYMTKPTASQQRGWAIEIMRTATRRSKTCPGSRNLPRPG